MVKKQLFLIIGITAATTAAVSALLVSIFERKQEARNPFFRVVEITDDMDDPAL